MKDGYIREGDIVEIDYITEFTKEHINEGKALVIWKGFNNQPLVRKLDTKATIWTCYEHIARVVGHIDIVGYMDRALSAEPCDDYISRQAVLKLLSYDWADRPAHKAVESIRNLPSVISERKTGRWIDDANKIDAQFGRHTYICSECGKYAEYFISGTEVWWDRIKPKFCPNCGARMEVSE